MSEEYQVEEPQGSNISFFTGLVAGAMIGAGFGILFAPRRGADLRRQMADSAASASQAMSKTVDEWTEQGRVVYDRFRDVASRAGNLVNRVSRDASRTAETTLDFAEDMASGAGRM